MGGADVICEAEIEILTGLVSWGDHTQDQVHVVQSIPFDVCSCVVAVPSSSHIPLLISIQRTTDPALHNKHLNSLQAAETRSNIHAPGGNEIHDVGDEAHTLILQRSPQQMPHLRRKRQGAVNRPPVFSDSTFRLTVPENSAVNTVVATVRAVDEDEGPNGSLMYSISSMSAFSRRLFRIDSTTGVITTAGMGEGEGRVHSGNEYFGAYESCCSVHILISYLVEMFTASQNED